jgi:hypothetical protein
MRCGGAVQIEADATSSTSQLQFNAYQALTRTQGDKAMHMCAATLLLDPNPLLTAWEAAPHQTQEHAAMEQRVLIPC